MKLKIVIFAFCLVTFNLNGQSFLEVDTLEYIEWNEEKLLVWSDYKYFEQSSNKNDGYALTTVFHSVRGGMKKGKPNFQVRVLYVKNKSWTTNVVSQELLNHEKLHFDLAEVYGRKMRKQIESLGNRGVKKLKTYKAYIEQILADFKSKSYEYDKETNHGREPSAQKTWNQFIQYELNRLNGYKYVNMNK